MTYSEQFRRRARGRQPSALGNTRRVRMATLDETFELANGLRIPRLGFGTWQIPDGDPAYDAVLFALRHGYRHVDTARAYGNEASVGRALRDSGLPRSSVFVTSKLPAEVRDSEG